MSRGVRLVLATGALYVTSRLFGLTALPAFLDETAHVRWAVEIASGEKLLRPWNYGKGLSIFLNALLFPWAFEHYLWASRALAVAFGAVSLLVGMAVARRLFDAGTGYAFGLLYLVCPFALFYDRLVLTDPPMATFAAVALVRTAATRARVRRRARPRPGASCRRTVSRRASAANVAIGGSVRTRRS